MVVIVAGGTSTAWPHLYYIPIVFAALAYGLKGGLVAGLIAGLAGGPLMPLEVDSGTSQPLAGWLTRLAFFVAIGMLAGTGRDRIVALAGARQEFLSSISHELRTPLTAVLGFSELMTGNGALSTEEGQEFAALIYQEATELSNVIDHYVLEGRLDSLTALPVDVSQVDLDQVIAVVLAGIPPQIRDSRIKVGGEHLDVDADPLRLRQVLRSLINHALAYGGSIIAIDVARDGKVGTVTVRDADGAPSAAPYGRDLGGAPAPPLGVGLVIAGQLAVLMGGRLSYEMQGTTSLQLRLPIAGATNGRLIRTRIRSLKMRS